MSRPAASWALMMQATASRYCSRKIESPRADLKERPCRLSVNQRGRGYEPVIAVGITRSCVTFSILASMKSGLMVLRGLRDGHHPSLWPIRSRQPAGFDRCNDDAGTGFRVRPCIVMLEGNMQVPAN